MPGKCFCCVPLCSNQRNRVDESISFHRIPKNIEFRTKWIASIRREEGENFKITDGTRVCSEHFCTEDFRPHLHTKLKLLKSNAVPSVFVWNSTLDLAKQDRLVRHLERTARGNRKKILKLAISEEREPDPENRIGSFPDDQTGVNASENQAGTDPVSIAGTFTYVTSARDLVEHAEVADPEHLSVADPGKFAKTFLGLTSARGLVEHDEIVVEVNPADFIDAASASTAEHECNTDVLKKEVQLLSGRLAAYQCYKFDKQKQLLRFENITEDSVMCFYTGLPTIETAQSLLAYLMPKVSSLQPLKGKNAKQKPAEDKSGLPCPINVANQFFLTLLRLKLGMPVKELARHYGVAHSSISDIFAAWINFLYLELKVLFPFPSARTVGEESRNPYGEQVETTIIVDCSEIRIQAPVSLSAQQKPSHVQNTVMKFLFGITPYGDVRFVSELYAWSAFNKEIIKDCGILDCLKNNDYAVTAEKGFEMEDVLPEKLPHVMLPNKSVDTQALATDVDKSRDKTRNRVRAKRASSRIKSYLLLGGVADSLPCTLYDISSRIVSVCGYLTNLHPAVKKKTLLE